MEGELSLLLEKTVFMVDLVQKQATLNWTTYFITMPKRSRLKQKIFWKWKKDWEKFFMKWILKRSNKVIGNI